MSLNYKKRFFDAELLCIFAFPNKASQLIMNWNKLISTKRFGLETYHKEHIDNRSEFQRDFDRLVFSAPFRRLQNKTQVFPLPGSIFVHNRLTHSLEVSCVGRSLGNNVSQKLLALHPELHNSYLSEIGAIVSAACLAHDLGNPPFGHSGEKAICSFFSEGGGRGLQEHLDEQQWNDFTHFEGNANAFRLLTHRFEGRREGGFVMTYSTLASIVKYPYASMLAKGKPKFGFFQSEEEGFKRIATDLGMICLQNQPLKYARHPLVYLVEAADDICYQLMDIEDAHKLKLLTTQETKDLLLAFFSDERKQHIYKTFDIVSDVNETIAYLRSSVVGVLIDECARTFVEHEGEILDGTFSTPLIEQMSERTARAYRQCADLSIKRIYKARDVVDIELAGFRVINTLLELMTEAVMHPDRAYSKLLINRVSSQYNMDAPELYTRIQAVLDYVSGMTDVFALDLYRKINGNALPAV